MGLYGPYSRQENVELAEQEVKSHYKIQIGQPWLDAGFVWTVTKDNEPIFQGTAEYTSSKEAMESAISILEQFAQQIVDQATLIIEKGVEK